MSARIINLLFYVAAIVAGPASTLSWAGVVDCYPQGKLTSAQGEIVDLADLRGTQATVFVFLSTECPISNGYIPALNELANDYGPQGAAIVGLNSTAGQSLADMEKHCREYEIAFPVLRDTDADVAEHLGANRTPEARVVDAAGTVRYRGRIDDRYTRRGGAPTDVRRADLREALDEILAGEDISVATTEVLGCPIQRNQSAAGEPPAGTAVATVNYSEHIAPLLAKHCQSCHRANGIGPFELEVYEQAVNWADDIRQFTADRTMPPWKPTDDWGDFANRRAMTAAEIELIDRWVRDGCPQGDPLNQLPAKPFGDGWTLGEPDVILEPTAEYTVSAEGRDEYRCFVLPTSFDRDLYVTAFEVLPGNARVVHHVIAFLDTSGKAAQLDVRDPMPGYATSQGFPGFFPSGGLGGWAPGNTGGQLPQGMAKILPQGAAVVMQVHYHKTGKPETDRTRLGLYLAEGQVTRPVFVLPVLPPGGPLSGMMIPAGAENHEIRASAVLPTDLLAVSITPHMHLLGKDMKVWATLPDGRIERLVNVERWDFNWQETYHYRQPVALPKGTRIDVVAHYDNSASNRNNPSQPPRTVYWGEQTTDEMCIAFIEVAPLAETAPGEVKAPQPGDSMRLILASQAEASENAHLPLRARAMMKWMQWRLNTPEQSKADY